MITSPRHTHDPQRIRTLIEEWRVAELTGDPTALDGLLADDFLGIGPMGWLRSKEQWLDKYRTGAVRNDVFDLADIQLRPLDSATLVVAHQSQCGVNGQHDTTGEFRFSLTVSGSRIRSIHVTRIIVPR